MSIFTDSPSLKVASAITFSQLFGRKRRDYAYCSNSFY